MKGYPCSVSGYQTCIVVTFTHSASFCVDGQVRKTILLWFLGWSSKLASRYAYDIICCGKFGDSL